MNTVSRCYRPFASIASGISPAARMSPSIDETYQFLPKSEIPTYHFQSSLKRLPIPRLEDSCRRLMNAAETILSKNRLKSLDNLVTNFKEGEGKALQNELILHDMRNLHSSYISQPWFDMYLQARAPCPVNYNPFMVYAPDLENRDNQLSRASNLVISYGRIKRSLDNSYLAPEVYFVNEKVGESSTYKWVCKLPEKVRWYGAAMLGAFPLDMSQYLSLFGGSRIPQQKKDWLFRCEDSKHFVVLRAGRIYSVRLFSDEGLLVQPEQVHACLAYILSNESRAQSNESIGSLTSLDRDDWAKTRLELSALGNNSELLNIIDSALFALCLDSTSSNDNPRCFVQALLAGNDASNRWFDKCFQLIVDPDGLATINFEHSWGDGVAVLRLIEESSRDIKKNHFVSENQTLDKSVDVAQNCRQLDFTLNDVLRKKLLEAQKKHVTVGSSLHCGAAEYFDMTRSFIKRSQLSPDSVMQLAIQLTYHKLYSEFVPTYESCSTAAFLKGRTECVRSATRCTRDAVLAIESHSENVAAFLNECSKTHSLLVREASLGQGFDRHLMGLRVTAKRMGWPEPELFTDSDFQYLNQFILSTSTLSTGTIVVGGFGPVVPDGFGIGYSVLPNKIGAFVTSYRGKHNAEDFAETLKESLDILRYQIEKKLLG